MPNYLGHLTPLLSDFTYGELSPKMDRNQKKLLKLLGRIRKRAGKVRENRIIPKKCFRVGNNEV